MLRPCTTHALLLVLVLVLVLASLPVSAQDTAAPEPLDPAASLAVANAFLDAATLEAKFAHVRDSDRVEPHLRSFYTGREPGALEPAHDALRPMPALGIDGVTCHLFHVAFKDGANRLLTVVPTAASPRVDWESYARHNPVPWKTFLAGKHEGAAPFRVFLQRTNYYNFRFSDREKFSAYRLTTPDLEKSLTGYAERGSELDRRLGYLIAASTPGVRRAPQRLILELADDGAGSVAHSQVRITALVATGWTIIEPAPEAEGKEKEADPERE